MKNRSDQHRLIGVQLEITNKCNLRCVHCYTKSGEKRPKELTFKELKRLIDELANLGVAEISLSGGEPLLRKDFVKIAKYIKKYDIDLTLNTNGTLLNKNKVQTLTDLKFDFVSVSIHGNNPKIHNQITQSLNSYEKAINGIKILKSEGVRVGITAAITNLNINEISLIFEKSLELGVDSFYTFRFLPIGRGKMYSKELEITPKQHKMLLETLREKEKKCNVRLAVQAPFFFEGDIQESNIITCMAGKNICSVTCTGDVLGCAGLRDQELVAGNIRKRRFTDIWHNSSILNILRRRNFAQEIEGFCRKCEYNYICKGGCRATTYTYTGNIFGSDPTCWME